MSRYAEVSHPKAKTSRGSRARELAFKVRVQRGVPSLWTTTNRHAAYHAMACPANRSGPIEWRRGFRQKCGVGTGSTPTKAVKSAVRVMLNKR